MLGKLIKNSFKEHASSVYNIYIAMGVIGILMLALLLVDWTKWGDTGIGLGLVIKCIGAFALCLTAFIGIIMTFVAVFSSFSRSMYGKEGSLTLTLPVRSSNLLFAKWLSGSFWVILSYTAFCLAAFGSAIYIIKHSVSLVEGDEMYYTVYQLVVEMITQLCEASGIATPSMAVIFNLASLYAISGGIKACAFVLTVYFAVTLAHCRPFSRLGKVGPLLYFFGGTFITSTFAGIVSKLIKVYMVVSDSEFTFTLSEHDVEAAWNLGFGAYSITNVYCTVITAVFMFLITAFLIDRKVNTD